MTTSNLTWREHPFVKGKIYTALISFTEFETHEFIAGKEYIFFDAKYSPYDSSTFLIFRENGKTESLQWFWNDDQPLSVCLNRFKITD
jgi:hypothetical protein